LQILLDDTQKPKKLKNQKPKKLKNQKPKKLKNQKPKKLKNQKPKKLPHSVSIALFLSMYVNHPHSVFLSLVSSFCL